MKSTVLRAASLLALLSFHSALASDVSPAANSTATPVIPEYAVGPCRIKIANMFGGYFDVPYPDASPPQVGGYYLPLTGPMAALNGGFSLFCMDATEERLTIALNAKYVDGRWLTYGPVNGPEFIPFDKHAHFQTIQLKGKNWIGRAYTADDTTGDEKRRMRLFYFCLIHDAHALCGYTPVARLATPKRNQLWKIKTILESVEFVDTSLAPESSSAASTTPSNQ